MMASKSGGKGDKNDKPPAAGLGRGGDLRIAKPPKLPTGHYTIDQAIDSQGFGVYHLLLLAFCGAPSKHHVSGLSKDHANRQ